jgi:hypothetical protein
VCVSSCFTSGGQWLVGELCELLILFSQTPAIITCTGLNIGEYSQMSSNPSAPADTGLLPVAPSTHSAPIPRRRGVRSVGVLVGVSMLSGGVGWVASRQLQSPADVAARTGPPAASRIVAPVELRVLRSTLFTRGTVRFGSPRAVTCVPDLKPGVQSSPSTRQKHRHVTSVGKV